MIHPTRATASAALIASFVLGAALVSANAAQRDTAPSLTVEQARAIVAPLYEALNEPTKKDVPALLAKAANPDYRSCSTNTDCLTRDQLAGVFTAIGKAIPDLRWTIVEIWTSGDRIVVRGEASGTPTGELFGAQPTGKGFKTISIDMFTVKNGKLATAYHVENWTAAIEQIRSPRQPRTSGFFPCVPLCWRPPWVVAPFRLKSGRQKEARR